MANLYINLLVTDLAKATAFYEALGFTKNLEFSNEDASAMKYEDSSVEPLRKMSRSLFCLREFSEVIRHHIL